MNPKDIDSSGNQAMHIDLESAAQFQKHSQHNEILNDDILEVEYFHAEQRQLISEVGNYVPLRATGEEVFSLAKLDF